MTRLPVWKLTRNPAGRALYDRLSDFGIRFAALETYRRPPGRPGDSSGDGNGDPLELTVREPTPDDDALRYKRSDASDADLVVIARLDGDPVGQVFLSRDRGVPVRELEATLRFDGVYVWRLYVDPEYRNRGIGSRLLTAALEAVTRRWGDEPLYALIAVDNHPSQRLFESQGFVPQSRWRYVRVGPLSRRWHGSRS